MDHRLRLDLARQVASEAGRAAYGFWLDRGALAVESKAGAQDLVSEADRSVERLIRRGIGAKFPQDGFLGEEYGLTAGTSGYTWVIDPIDGTTPFLSGMPNWCVAIALLHGVECVAAVTEVVTHGETFSAFRGEGAWLNGHPLRTPQNFGIGNALVGIGASAKSDPLQAGEHVRALLQAGGMFFRNGSGALMLAYVAAGRLAGYFEALMHPWDSLGGLLLVAEAGGRVAPFRNSHDLEAMDRVLAAGPAAWDDLVALFEPDPADTARARA
jgi:myo-inositol-1(or 4)-monophosphatase